jgi:hypothetical protein
LSYVLIHQASAPGADVPEQTPTPKTAAPAEQQAPVTTARRRGRQERGVWTAIKPAVMQYLRDHGEPHPDEQRSQTNLEEFIAELIGRRREEPPVSRTAIRRHIEKYVEDFLATEKDRK